MLGFSCTRIRTDTPLWCPVRSLHPATKPPTPQQLQGGCTCALPGPTLAVSHSRNGIGSDARCCAAATASSSGPKKTGGGIARSRWEQVEPQVGPAHEVLCTEEGFSLPTVPDRVCAPKPGNCDFGYGDAVAASREACPSALAGRWSRRGGTRQRSYPSSWTRLCQYQDAPSAAWSSNLSSLSVT